MLANVVWSVSETWSKVVRLEPSQAHTSVRAPPVDVVGLTAKVAGWSSVSRSPHVRLPRCTLFSADLHCMVLPVFCNTAALGYTVGLAAGTNGQPVVVAVPLQRT